MHLCIKTIQSCNNTLLIPIAAEVVIAPPPAPVVDAGNTVVVACVVYGSPAPNITWSRDGNILSNDTRVTIYDELVTESGVTFVQSILEICSATPSDGGQYICLATNFHGNDNATFDLTVNPVSGMYQASLVSRPEMGRRKGLVSTVCVCA